MTNKSSEQPAKPKRAPRAKKTESSDSSSKTPKKRGRKPKGGKIVTVASPEENIVVPTPNVILHLKCGANDLKNNGFFSNKCYEYDPSDVSGKLMHINLMNKLIMLYLKVLHQNQAQFQIIVKLNKQLLMM